MVRRQQLRLAFALAFFAAGCGAPTTPSALPTALTLVPQDDLIIATANVTYSVVGTFADGSNHGVPARWVIDNPGVAIVNGNGTVTGVGPGSATLIATAGGQTATRVLRVVPDFSRTWTGQSKVTGCSAGDFRTCGRCCPNGQVHTIALTLGQTRDAASGTLQIDVPTTGITPMYTGAVAGPIQLDGSLVLQGTLSGEYLFNGQPQTIPGPALFDWSTTVSAPGTMTGHFTSVTPAGLFYPTRVSYDLTLLRVSR